MDVRQHSDVVADSLRSDLAGVAEELRSEIQDVKRHSDVVAESLHGEIRLVAEGVAGLDEKFTQKFVTVREEIREQIGEVKKVGCPLRRGSQSAQPIFPRPRSNAGIG
jgi:hypothetical protein